MGVPYTGQHQQIRVWENMNYVKTPIIRVAAIYSWPSGCGWPQTGDRTVFAERKSFYIFGLICRITGPIPISVLVVEFYVKTFYKWPLRVIEQLWPSLTVQVTHVIDLGLRIKA